MCPSVSARSQSEAVLSQGNHAKVISALSATLSNSFGLGDSIAVVKYAQVESINRH